MKDIEGFILAPCKPAVDTACCGSAPASSNPPGCAKKDNTMSRYYDEDLDAFVEGISSDTQLSRSYLTGRIDNIFSKTDRELELKFGVRNDEQPRTFSDALARLTAGK